MSIRWSRRAPGFTPQEIELDASAILQGEPAATPVVVNDRAYTIRVRFPESTRAIARPDSQHRDHQQLHGKDARRWARWPSFRTKPGRPKFVRENLQRRRRGDRPVRRHEPGQRDGRLVQKAVADMDLPPSIRVVYGGTYEEQQKSFRDLAGGAGAGGGAGVHGAAVRIRHLRRARPRFWLRRCFPLRACSSRC